jgi:hypothetical protein
MNVMANLVARWRRHVINVRPPRIPVKDSSRMGSEGSARLVEVNDQIELLG